MAIFLPPGAVPDQTDVEVLFPEARQFQRRRRLIWSVISLLVVTVAIVLGTVLTTPSATKPPTAPRPLASPGSIAQFVRSAVRATNATFTATYQVSGNGGIFSYDGRYSISRLPGPPGAKPIVNGDGSWPRGHYAYIVHATDGTIIQWIENGAKVSTCAKLPHERGALAHSLHCFGPFPDIAANGFIMETVAFVPNMAVQQVDSMKYPKATSYFTVQSSSNFGELRCLQQNFQNEHLNTCENVGGFIVSSKWRSNNQPVGPETYWTNAILTSLSHHASGGILTTLKRPTSRATTLPPE